jgi:hypothetical protein
MFTLVPNLQVGNPSLGSSSFLSFEYGKLELPRQHSQAGAWERAKVTAYFLLSFVDFRRF